MISLVEPKTATLNRVRGEARLPLQSSLRIEICFNVVKVELDRQPFMISAQTDWTHTKLTEDDHKAVITVSTDPSGFESMVDLTVDSVTPSNPEKGTVTKISDTEWHYVSFDESKTDKWPGRNGQGLRDWEVTIKDNWCGTTKKLWVWSVFKYCKTKELDNAMALDYVEWKYENFIITNLLSVGTYDAGLGNYGQTTTYGATVTYGPQAFHSENVLLSIIGHESVHVNQMVLTRYYGGLEMALYEALVAAGVYPTPPALPPAGSEGLRWGELEYPGYKWEYDNRMGTGIVLDPDYMFIIIDLRDFFKFLKDYSD